MISVRQPDGSYLTTPIMIGSPKQVKKMQTCLTHNFQVIEKTTDHDGLPLEIHQCTRCGCIRSRHWVKDESTLTPAPELSIYEKEKYQL